MLVMKYWKKIFLFDCFVKIPFRLNTQRKGQGENAPTHQRWLHSPPEKREEEVLEGVLQGRAHKKTVRTRLLHGFQWTGHVQSVWFQGGPQGLCPAATRTFVLNVPPIFKAQTETAITAAPESPTWSGFSTSRSPFSQS